MSACGGLLYNNLTLQWTKSLDVAEWSLAQLRNFEVPVDLREAPAEVADLRGLLGAVGIRVEVLQDLRRTVPGRTKSSR